MRLATPLGGDRQRYAAALHELTVGRLPLALRSWCSADDPTRRSTAAASRPEDKEAEIEYVLFCALAVALVRRWLGAENRPGAPSSPAEG